jgi:hypothetical protein
MTKEIPWRCPYCSAVLNTRYEQEELGRCQSPYCKDEQERSASGSRESELEAIN